MHTDTTRQGGAGMVGFLLALPPLLGVGLGGVELAHWMHQRQAISLILADAARAGATRQARPQDIARAFETGLRQLYIQPQLIERALRTRRQALGTPWTMRILQPTPAAFRDHADPDVKGPRQHPGQALIRNDYQARQHARRIAQGWPAGRGPQSGLTIHEANTLVIDLWWPQLPMIPGIAALIRGLAPLSSDPIGRRMMARGYLPMRRQVRMVMQSHPADWSDLADGRIRYAAPGHAGAGDVNNLDGEDENRTAVTSAADVATGHGDASAEGGGQADEPPLCGP
ncbi:TadE/TadG family type IV pilus assembly protein [Castellaniella hirudinis]|uniref:TadE/TadG family type IV pilus assembly protein n=1 Tax=Castellaniella hirudinis TaxID=1144617 RepID=UPI0039C23EB8